MSNEAKAKRLSVERIYQKKTQLEHILLRPDTYVGSIEETTKQMWIYDDELEAIVCKNITFVPGLYKIFDEILGLLCCILRFINNLCVSPTKSTHLLLYPTEAIL